MRKRPLNLISSYTALISTILLITTTIFLSGCNKQSEFAQFCADNVKFEFLNMEEYYDGGICYKPQGVISTLIYNSGNVPIESFVIHIYGTNGTFNGELKQRIPANDVVPIDLGFSIKETGEVKDFMIIPRAKYHNKTRLCEISKKFLTALKLCELNVEW